MSTLTPRFTMPRGFGREATCLSATQHRALSPHRRSSLPYWGKSLPAQISMLALFARVTGKASASETIVRSSPSSLQLDGSPVYRLQRQ